jgi:hypothetical protein
MDSAWRTTPMARRVVSVARKMAPDATAAQSDWATATRSGNAPKGIIVRNAPTSAARGWPGGCEMPRSAAAATNSPPSCQYPKADAVATYSAKGTAVARARPRRRAVVWSSASRVSAMARDTLRVRDRRQIKGMLPSRPMADELVPLRRKGPGKGGDGSLLRNVPVEPRALRHGRDQAAPLPGDAAHRPAQLPQLAVRVPRAHGRRATAAPSGWPACTTGPSTACTCA